MHVIIGAKYILSIDTVCYICYRSLIQFMNWWCKLHMLLNNNVCIPNNCIQCTLMIHDTCYGLLLLWIYSISYRSMMWVITCHQLMHATHVTIFVAISMNVLFLCYGFYVLVYFGLLGYVTYIIDQIFDK
jgi:hypothetical protein